MNLDISVLNVYGLVVLNGVVTGLSITIGNYIASEHIISKSRNLFKKIFRKDGKK